MRESLSSPTPLKKERRNRTLARLLGAVFILAVLFIGAGLLSHIPKMMITEVEVTGTKVLDGEDVGLKTLEYLKGNVALFYARGNIFIYSKNNIIEFIKQEFPRVYQVTGIERHGRKLNIDLEERQAAFTWCGFEAPSYETRFEKRDCYFMDQTGFIFDQSPYFTPGVYLSFYGGIKSDISHIGQTIITENSVVGFGEIAKTLSSLKLPVHSVVIKSDGQNEFLLNIFTSTGTYARILFNEDVALAETLEKLESAAGEESFAAQFEDSGTTLEYIDTRFDNRVFYKFKEI